MALESSCLLQVLLLPLLCLLEGSGGIVYQVWTNEQNTGWSMTTAEEIIGFKGQSAVLPCNFTHPHGNYQGNIRVIWRKKEGESIIQIFQCTVTNSRARDQHPDPCNTGNYPYRLAGDPRHSDLSLEIRDLNFTRIGRYYCRVELVNETGAKWETYYGTNLLVNAPATIRNFTVKGNATLVCEVEGNPLPNITWRDPTGKNMSDAKTTSGDLYVKTQELTVRENGTYTCVSMNEYATVSKTVVVGELQGPNDVPVIVIISVLIPLLLVLLLVLFLCWKRKGLLFKSYSKRNQGDTNMLTQKEAREPEPQSGQSQDGATTYADVFFTKKQEQEKTQDVGTTYAEVVFTKKPEKGNKKEAPPAPQVEEDVTYAVVAIREDKQNGSM